MSKIGIIGDAFIDKYWIGTSRGLSAEVPIPIIDITETKLFPGGAANVRANFRSLGEDAVMLFKSLDSAANYPIKNRLITDGVQIARWDENDYSTPFTYEDLKALDDVDAVVVSDYSKGALQEDVINFLANEACRGVPVFVDTKKDPKEWLGFGGWLFPNLQEYKKYESSYSWFPNVLLKQGPLGCSLVQYGKVVLTSPSIVNSVVSVNGAGDTVLAAFVSKYLSGANLDHCLEFAMAAAGAAVSKPYTSTVTIEEVEEFLYPYGAV